MRGHASWRSDRSINSTSDLQFGFPWLSGNRRVGFCDMLPSRTVNPRIKQNTHPPRPESHIILRIVKSKNMATSEKRLHFIRGGGRSRVAGGRDSKPDVVAVETRSKTD